MSSSVVYRRKCALIIGINYYPRDPLQYCINDATDLQTALECISFDVSPKTNCNLSEFYDTVNTFAEKIQRDDLALFYFSGHGKQVEDQNYLLPSNYDYDYRGHERDYVSDHAVNVQYIMKKIDDRKCRITIYLFDCCRHLIRTRGMNEKQGLLAMNAPSQTLIVYACAPGKAVQDETRNNRNGSFIEKLLKYVATPNKDIEEIMKDVAHDVNLQTDGFQLPYRTSSLTNKVFLVMKNSQDLRSNECAIEDSSEVVAVRLGNLNANDCLVLDSSCRDQRYDRDFTNIRDIGNRLTRGGLEYHRPYGWKRYGIKVIGKYDDEIWLGSNNNPKEWPVSYHGTGHEAAKAIAQTGYDLTKHKRFTFGRGIYTMPDIKMAKGYARSFTHDGEEYLVVLQNRVNPKNLIKLSRQETGVGESWISPNATDVRPYGICIMKKQ